jgi:oligopeptide/dipeptide ABC transporter ATP-binding protein
MDVMREIREQTGAAMLLISHDLGLVAGTAERVLVMYGGRILESGAVADIFYRTRNPYTRGLLRSIPRGRRQGQRLTPITGAPPSPLDMPVGCPFQPRCSMAVERCRSAVPDLDQVDYTVSAPSAHRSRCWRHAELDEWHLEEST